MDVEDEPSFFDIRLKENVNYNLRPVDRKGNLGMIFHFDDITIPRR